MAAVSQSVKPVDFAAARLHDCTAARLHTGNVPVARLRSTSVGRGGLYYPV
jgi:hypothetical protein